MSGVQVIGWGVVSPAGHGIEAFRTACHRNVELATTEIKHPGRRRPLKIRRVPLQSPRPSFLSHPRLRRSSAISMHAAGAALEALGQNGEGLAEGRLNLGLVFTTQTGCVSYSRRFYHETLEDPSTASPIVFPETVFNAPASHIGTYLNSNLINYTLVGDPGTFLQGLAVAGEWLIEGRVDMAVVVGAEELDWIVCGAQHLFDRNVIVSEGAGALVLQRASTTNGGVWMEQITEPALFTSLPERISAAQAVQKAITQEDDQSILIDSRTGAPAVDRAEAAAWADWQGARCSPKRMLGESYAAGSAWQCVLAADLLSRGDHSSAIVNVVGCNQQAIAARFVRT